MKTFKAFISESKKLKNKLSLSIPAKKFIDLWVSGESKALRILTPQIKEELKNSLSQESYRLMRTWKFPSQEDVDSFFGGTSLERGRKLEVSLNSPTSWTKAPKIAKSFSNPRIDGFSKKFISDDDLEEMEYEEGDLLSISVTVFAVLNKFQILADLENIEGIREHQDEKEIIVDSGVVTLIPVKIQDWFFVKDKEDDSISIVDLNPNDDQLNKENSIIESKIKTVESEIKKGKTPEEILENSWEDSDIIALAMTSGVKNPNLLLLIKEKAKNPKMKKTLSFFNVFSIISMVETWK